MEDLSMYVSVTARRTQIFYTEKLKELGISSGQFMYIVSICDHTGQTQDELAHRLIIDKSTVAKVLVQLETSGFITKEINVNDRRSFHIFPTAKALSAYPYILEIKAAWHQKMTENLSELEREIFAKLMEKVMDNSIKNCKKYMERI